MKDMRLFEGLTTEQVSDKTERSDAPLNSQSECGTKERQSNRQHCGLLLRSYYVISLQEADSHFHEEPEFAAEQLHINQGADQIILFHMSTFGPGNEDRRSDSGHVKATLL